MDYCNAAFAGPLHSTIMCDLDAEADSQLHNAAVRLVFELGPRDAVSRALIHLHKLHWIPLSASLRILQYPHLCCLIYSRWLSWPVSVNLRMAAVLPFL
jgi:hypothetical protein